jgi:hypothetical protein
VEVTDPQSISELPDSFEDALSIAVDCGKRALDTGLMRLRVDFDTTAGDMTYTMLKNSMPLVRAVPRMLRLHDNSPT